MSFVKFRKNHFITLTERPPPKKSDGTEGFRNQNDHNNKTNKEAGKPSLAQ